MPPFNCSAGYTGYGHISGTDPCGRFVENGIITFSYDPICVGTRREEGRDFYDFNPGWSLMGKMAADALHAADAVLKRDEVDRRRIFLVGYAMGALAALTAAALDKSGRIAGVACIAGLTPFRSDSPEKGTGGLARYSMLHGLIPRMGMFIGREKEVPVDLEEIISCVVPGRVLIIAPKYDRHASYCDLQEAMVKAGRCPESRGRPGSLKFITYDDWNRLTDPVLDEVAEWVKNG